MATAEENEKNTPSQPLTPPPLDEKKSPPSLDYKWKVARDILLFFGGMMGVANEAIFQSTTDPTLLILFGAMMGLPAFLRKDEK